MKIREIYEHQAWKPYAYQTRAINHLLSNKSAFLWLKPGAGKTAIVLSAIENLIAMGPGHKALIIAPLRVAQLVWEQEAARWTQFRKLRFARVLGDAKARKAALAQDADVYLINYDNVPWLCSQYKPGDMPFTVMVADESTKLKNPGAFRVKQLIKHSPFIQYKWGLTGTPAPNGYEDLFGQFRVIDDGARLGRYVTHYRSKYFVQDYSGFGWRLMHGADKEIEAVISDIVFSVNDAEYQELPPVISSVIEVEMPASAKRAYKEMHATMVAQLSDKTTVTAANTAAAYSKLAQMANGRVYGEDRSVTVLHNAKLEALQELVEELSGDPLLVGYAFQHDLMAILSAFPGAPVLASRSEKHVREIVEQWNAGAIPVLPIHPASIGHGVNMQLGSACNLCWYGLTWDAELYEQTIRRILRNGTKATHIFEHFILANDTLDKAVVAAVRSKQTTQQKLVDAIIGGQK